MAGCTVGMERSFPFKGSIPPSVKTGRTNGVNCCIPAPFLCGWKYPTSHSRTFVQIKAGHFLTLFIMCAKHKVATLSASTESSRAPEREREKQEPHTDVHNLAPLGDNTKSNYSPHKASGVELKPPLSAHRAGRGEKKSAHRCQLDMPDPRASQLPSPTHVLCKVFVLLTKATSHNIAATPSQTATHGYTTRTISPGKTKEPFAPWVKRLPNPSPTSDSGTFVKLCTELSRIVTPPSPFRRQREFVPFRPASIHLG